MFFGVGCCSLLGFVMEALLALILWGLFGLWCFGGKKPIGSYLVFVVSLITADTVCVCYLYIALDM